MQLRLFSLLLSLLLWLISTAAQAAGGSISGCVIDESGGKLPGVSIEVSGPGLNKALIVTSETSGCYRVPSLAEGSYQLSFSLSGFATAVKSGVFVAEGRESIADAVLRISMQAEVTVVGRKPLRSILEESDNLIGIAETASEGAVRSEQLALRPLLRPADTLESVPGLVISQHSGQGKANQYYLRGFNLDHGTDLAVAVDDIPANFPTHGHGQGYLDLNFVIPELINDIQFKKGPYSSEDGDFASAGAVRMDYSNNIDRPIAGVEGGSFQYGRILLAGSPSVGGGKLLYGIEGFYNNGPWENEDNYKKINGLLRYSFTRNQNFFQMTGMAYAGEWNSTDQIPQRGVSTIGRFGAIDPTDGGDTSRFSLSGGFRHSWGDGLTEASAYLLRYQLNLFSNFTYFLDDPVNGDQFEQEDQRTVGGFHLQHRWLSEWGGFETENQVGIQFRNDNIDSVGLFHTKARERLSTIRQDQVDERTWSFYAENRWKWSDKIRTVVGLRADLVDANVDSNLELNSGNADDSLLSPKFSLIVGPWKKVEYYFNFGYGFHSNDARGATIHVDPLTLEPADSVDLLVRTKGTEFGFRSAIRRYWQSSFSIWLLDIDSELLFVGDAGGTEASRPSRRVGFEWTNYYKPFPWFTLDASWAQSRARFRDDDPAGDRIPGSVEGVISAGVTLENLGVNSPLKHTVGVIKSSGAAGRYQPGSVLANLIFSFYVRYFGPRPLIEDNSVRSDSSTTVNAAVGYKLNTQWNLFFDVFNLFNADSSDIDYFYTSRLPGEPLGGVEDVHFHPLEPISFRLSITKSW